MKKAVTGSPVRLTIAGLILSIALINGGAAWCAQDAPPPEIDIRADTSSYDEQSDTFTADGNIAAKIGDMNITADKALVRRGAGEIEIPGAVTFTRGGETFTGRALKYNYKTETGSLEDAAGCFGGVNVRGDTLEFAPGLLTFHGASASTCPLDNPDYHVRARTVEVATNGRVKFKGIGFYLWNRRLLKLGSISTTIGAAATQQTGTPAKEKKRYAGFKLSPPSAGYDAVGGLNVRAGFYRQLTQSTILRLRATHFLSEGTFPEAAIERPTNRALYTVRYGTQYKENTGYSRYMGPVKVWNLPTVSALYAARTLPNTRLRYSFDAEAGRLRERRNPKPISRIYSKIFLSYPLNPGDPLTFSLVAEGRYGIYTGWRKYRVLGSGIAADFTHRKRHSFGLQYLNFQDNGRTFFFSDLVNTHDRVFFRTSSRITTRTTAWLDGEYDIDAKRTVEVEYGLTRTYKCIQFQAGWRKELKAAMFRIYILGLGSKN